MTVTADPIRCPSCGRTYAYKPELAGRRVKCKCGAAIQVPAAAPPDEDPPDFSDMAAYEPAGAAVSAPPPTPAPVPASTPAGRAVPTAKADAGKADDWKWWYYVGAGAGLAAVSFFEFSRLSDLESGAVRSVRLRSWEAAIYSVLGKWGVVGVMLAIAAFLVGVGLYRFAEERKQQRG